MELELGLKITKTRDDIASISEYQLAKDRAGPVFQSRETNTLFILTAHLKGYKRNNIDIKISEDGSKISISGEKPVQEMVMMGWVMHRKLVDVKRFNKIFKIPDGVNLDRIKAKYDEEEWTLNIFMPKLVKGICGSKIEEVREELEKSETDHVSSSVGETSQKGTKESQVQDMEGSESIMDKKEGGIACKMLDDYNKEINKETTQKEVIRESKLGIEDGNGESVREKVGKEECETMKTPELEKIYEDTRQDKGHEVQKMDNISVEKKEEEGVFDKFLDDANEVITRDTIKNGSAVKKGKMVYDNMLDDVNRDMIGEMNQKEKEKSKLGIGEGNGDSVKEKVGDTSQGVSEESMVQQSGETKSIVEKMEKEGSTKILVKANGFTEEGTSGESKQKEFGEPKCKTENRLKESEKESSVGQFEAMEELDPDQNLLDHSARDIGGISQEEFEKSRIQQMEKTKSTEGKMDGGEYEKTHVEANKDIIKKSKFGDTIQKGIIKPNIETGDGDDQECVREKSGKEGFDENITTKEEFPKHSPKTTLEEIEGLNVQKMQETKDVKEEMVKRKGKEIEYFVEKGEGERPKRMHVEEKKGITRETMQDVIEKSENGIKESGQQQVGENTIKEIFELPKSVAEDLPKQVTKNLNEGKRFKVGKEEEQKEVVKEAMAETESLMEKVEEEESKKRNKEASRVIEKNTITEIMQKKIEESNIERKTRDGPHAGEFEVVGTVQEKLPKQEVEETAQDEKDKFEYGIVKLKGKGSTKMHVEPNEAFEEDTAGDKIEKEIRKQKPEPSDQMSGNENVDSGIFDGRKRQKLSKMKEMEDVKKDSAKIEQYVKKVNGDKYEKIQDEANEGLKNDITRETTGKEIEDPKTHTKEKDEQCLQEEISKERFQESKAAKEEFPMKIVDSPANTREGLKDTEMEKTEGVEEEGAEIEQLVKKVKGETYEKIQAEAKGGLRNDITKETTQEETEEPKILIKAKDQQCLQEEMSKGRHEVSTTAKEFPMQIVDSLAKTRERPKDKEIEEEEEAKRESAETTVVESTTKEKVRGIESENISHAKAIGIGTPERDLQLASMGEEVEQGSTKDMKQKTKLLPPQSKETHESKTESMNQDTLKPKKTKEAGEQCIHKPTSTKEVETIEDQVVKPLSTPRFPSTQLSKVEDKLYEGSKAKYEASLESQKEDPTKEMQNFVEMKENQEAKQKENLKQEIPLEKHLKKRGQVMGKDEFHKGEKMEKTMKEKTEGPKKVEIDDRDQQYVARGVGKVETIENETFKEYLADAGPIAERMETIGGLKTTLEREEYITTQDVNDDGKPKIHGEVIKADMEKVDKAEYIAKSKKTTQGKKDPIKHGFVEKEAESLEAISSLPKNEIAELHQKELSPLTTETKSKEPIHKLEKPIMQWKLPKTKEHVPIPPEIREREPHGYGKEEIKASEIATYQGANKPLKLQGPTMTQQSIDEESENAVEANEATKESPKVNIVETKETDSLQPQVLENQSFEQQNVDGQNVALDQWEFQGPKISIKDKGQQYVQENNDKKRYQTPKALEEELLKQEQKAEIVLKKREGPKVAKSEEGKDASRLESERGKTTETVEEKKPIMKEINPQYEKASGFKQSSEKMLETPKIEHQREEEEEEEEVTSKIGVRPPTIIEKPPNKGVKRKEPREQTWPTMDYRIQKIEEVQQEKEGQRYVHALEETISKEEGPAQATATHSKEKSKVEPKIEIDKPQDLNELPYTSKEMLGKEPRGLDELSRKEDDSKAESLMQVRERKESIHSIETLQQESQADQQCTNKDQEEKQGRDEIEEEKACEQVQEEQKECKEEANGGKKDDRKMSKNLFVPLIIAGSALLVSLVVIFVRHRRARKRLLIT